MTYLECIWQDKPVFVYSLLSKSSKIHAHVKQWIGKSGVVLGESKNNQLLVQFTVSIYHRRTVAIPPGCLMLLDDVDFAIKTKKRKGNKVNGNTNSI